eukprot:m.51725 g.51725  ORF g.51725 m.51725 type:complete len:172 (-) comp6636_c1_seq1:112-627(-)
MSKLVPAETLADPVFSSMFARLYDAFGTDECWELIPGAREAVEQLAEQRPAGAALGVLSNFDERIHSILGCLGLREHFDFVLCSREAGVEKPDPAIFSLALAQAPQCARAHPALHVGDTLGKDVVGALDAGWQVVHITTKPAGSSELGESGLARYMHAESVAALPRLLLTS